MKTKLLLGALVLSTLFACKKKIADPYERIAGKWVVDNQQLLGQTVAGDGSYITFGSCPTKLNCTANDYKASDSTTGTITFSIAEDESTILFSDTMDAGGYYNGTYDITLFTNKSLHIKAASIFGDVKIEFDKKD